MPSWVTSKVVKVIFINGICVLICYLRLIPGGGQWLDNEFVDCCVADLFDCLAPKARQWNVRLLLSWVTKVV